MNILYVTVGKLDDYLNDMIFHGLYTLFGNQVVDSNCMTFMYKPYMTDKNRSIIHGKGFTLYGTIEKDDIDRTEIDKKIRSRFYDLIIYGSVHRYLEYYDLVKQYYPKNRIAFLDGEDIPHLAYPFCSSHIYFKRELIIDQPNIFPISFSIPPKKVIQDRQSIRAKKNKWIATCVPDNFNTYIFNDEQTYYKDYQESFFGITMKKAGWDCLRHYEIIANYCMPFFIHIGDCPPNTMFNFPKQLCLEASQLLSGNYSETHYYDLLDAMFDWLLMNLTTDKLALYVIDTLRSIQKG